LHDARDDADAMQVASRWLLGVSAALGDEKKQSAFCRGRFDRAKRSLASDEQRHGDIREDDDVAKRKYRETTQV
jgi:hypothetical protein